MFFQGQRVKVKNDFYDMRFRGDPGINDDMIRMAGKEFIIADSWGSGYYKLVGDSGSWTWAEQWLEEVDTVRINISEDDLLSVM